LHIHLLLTNGPGRPADEIYNVKLSISFISQLLNKEGVLFFHLLQTVEAELMEFVDNACNKIFYEG